MTKNIAVFEDMQPKQCVTISYVTRQKTNVLSFVDDDDEKPVPLS